ncbi:MAG: hypothetical protein JXR36_09635 [Bacteroidales bacterium]|nr:hypothetical protein [Bacteroidales bacterium]
MNRNQNISSVFTECKTLRYQYSNHIGSACLELDGSAAIISYEEYHPFGTTSYRSGRNEVDVSLKRYKYVGKERDEETGLYYYGARYYAAWIARFVSVDPLQHEYPHYTPYQYAGNKPITYIDLDGLEEVSFEEKRKEIQEQAKANANSDSNNSVQGESLGSIGSSTKSNWYCPTIPKYKYYGNGWDYIAAIDNGVINLINIIPNTWNSGVGSVEAMQKGVYFEGLGQEFYQMGVGIKDYTVNSWKNSFSTPIDEQMTHTWNQIKDPQTTEFASTLFFGSKIPMKTFTTSSNTSSSITNINYTFFRGGKSFSQYKAINGGGGYVGEIKLMSPHKYYGTNFPIRVEYSHRWITQSMQRKYNLPNWMVNNKLNVIKTNTLRHAGHDTFRYRFLPREIKLRLAPGGDLNYNMFGN